MTGADAQADHGPRRRPHAPGEGRASINLVARGTATCTCSAPRPASASATEQSPRPGGGGARSGAPPPPAVRVAAPQRRADRWRRLTGGRPPAVPRWSRGTRDHRRPARPRPARPALVDPAGAVARGPPGRPAPRHLPARRAVRPAVRPASSRSRRSRTTWPGASTTCCACCSGWTSPASSRSASSAGARPPTASRWTPCLLTRHLQFSLPYRALFSQTLRPDTAQRLVDALAVLLVRLHLTGFCWGDVLAVQHAVPARRRRLRRLPGRRRDRRDPRPALRRPARARPGDRPGQHRRRADGPGGRRLARRGRRPGRDLRARSSTATARCGAS